VLSIDVATRSTVPHERIEYLAGSSVAPPIVEAVRDRIDRLNARRLLFVLDADHSAARARGVRAVRPRRLYLHVQDGLLDYLPRIRSLRPGPAAAVGDFLAQHPEFERDLDLEDRYAMTAHIKGWLRRLPEAPGPDQGD
jgi:cephalosporin hydroxylase